MIKNYVIQVFDADTGWHDHWDSANRRAAEAQFTWELQHGTAGEFRLVEIQYRVLREHLVEP